ncbi:MAG: flagellar assembly peptidoglycan hydrolase FlgJ [Gammaproteobacteria bacterium]|jgi:flagellar protein FlgJ
MVTEVNVAGSMNIAGLGELRASSSRNDPAALAKAAQQFEALFLQMMLKSMRSAGSSFAEDRDRSYEEMFDREIAVELARSDSLGIADLLLKQIGHGQEAAVNRDFGSLSSAPKGAAISLVPDAARGGATGVQDDFRPESPADFVEQIVPLATKTAESLGIDPHIVIAQAALESGWGEHQIRDPRGVSANNLFGIKADPQWTGDRVTVRTLEHENGAFVPRQESFRRYPTLEAGFSDYAAYLSSNPRYRNALAAGPDAVEFTRQLQEAGYATDPDYADKLVDILGGRLNALLAPSGKAR